MAIVFIEGVLEFGIKRDVVIIKGDSGGDTMQLAMSLHEFRIAAIEAQKAIDAHDASGSVVGFPKEKGRKC